MPILNKIGPCKGYIGMILETYPMIFLKTNSYLIILFDNSTCHM